MHKTFLSKSNLHLAPKFIFLSSAFFFFFFFGLLAYMNWSLSKMRRSRPYIVFQWHTAYLNDSNSRSKRSYGANRTRKKSARFTRSSYPHSRTVPPPSSARHGSKVSQAFSRSKSRFKIESNQDRYRFCQDFMQASPRSSAIEGID